MDIERGESNPSESEDAPQEIESEAAQEKLGQGKTKVVIFDAPFHSDPELANMALDDLGMKKEIPRGALGVATLLGRHGYDTRVVPMDAFLNKEFQLGQEAIEEIKQEFPGKDSATLSKAEMEKMGYPPERIRQEMRLQSPREGVANEIFYITKMRETIQRLMEKESPDVVAFSYMFSPTDRSVIAMVRYIKEHYPEKMIVVGGNAATFDKSRREKLLNPNELGVDAIISYEGEWTMLDLIENLEMVKKSGSSLDLSKIKGLSYWQNGKITKPERRERGNPDGIGPLSYERVILPEEVNLADFNHYVLYARGCLGRCAFCTSSQMYRRAVTSVGLESFHSELEYVSGAIEKRKEGEKNIGLLDDDLLLGLWLDASGQITNDPSMVVERKTVFEIIEPILIEARKRHPEINFIAQARVSHLRGAEFSQDTLKPKVNTLVDNPEKLLARMKAAGINLILLGIESGSQEILDASLKDTKVEWVEPACRLVKKAGIDVGAFWIIGLPGATKEREEKSLAFLDRLIKEGLIDDLEAHVFIPLPGSTARLSKGVSKNIRYDADIDESSRKSYFDNGATYEHIDEKGEVVLSKADVKELKDEYDKRVLDLKRK